MSDELAQMRQESRPDGLVIWLSGEIDLSNIDRLQRTIDRASEGQAKLVLDLAAVEYIDSQGLRLITQLARKLDSAGTAFEIVAPPESVARSVLDLTGMSGELSVS